MGKRMKKIIWNVLLLLISTSGISAFVFFAQRGEAGGNWIPAAIFFGVFAFIAIVGLIDCCIAKEEDL